MTGLDALSRSGDLDNLRAALQDLAQVGMIKQAVPELNRRAVTVAILAGHGLPASKYLLTDEQVAAEQAAQQAANAQTASEAADRRASWYQTRTTDTMSDASNPSQSGAPVGAQALPEALGGAPAATQGQAGTTPAQGQPPATPPAGVLLDAPAENVPPNPDTSQEFSYDPTGDAGLDYALNFIGQDWATVTPTLPSPPRKGTSPYSGPNWQPRVWLAPTQC